MAAERPTSDGPPAEALLRAGPLTELAGVLLGRWLRALPARGPLRATAITIEPDAILLEVEASGPRGLALGHHGLRFQLLRAAPAESEWRWGLVKGAGLSRAAAWGLGLVPEEAVDRFVTRALGAGVRVRGERLLLDHASLGARWLNARDGVR